jgi:hypothetical protein
MLPYDAYMDKIVFSSQVSAQFGLQTLGCPHIYSHANQPTHTLSSYYVIAFCASIGSNVSTDLLSCQNCFTQCVRTNGQLGRWDGLCFEKGYYRMALDFHLFIVFNVDRQKQLLISRK